MDLKTLSAIISVILVFVAFPLYFRDMLRKNTQPHIYTWLIWAITQGTATAGIWYANGGVGAWGPTIGTLFVITIFLLSFKYGTKNITRTDTVMLIAALLAVVAWWQFNSPLAAVLMVSAIDLLGYLPSFRKSFQEPWSETVLSWAGFALSNIFALLALSQYNLLTTTYLVSICAADIIMVFICLARRPFVKRPVN